MWENLRKVKEKKDFGLFIIKYSSTFGKIDD